MNGVSLDKITRLEVIDSTGRAYTKYNVSVEFSIQDEGRTLKLFVKSVGEKLDKLCLDSGDSLA